MAVRNYSNVAVSTTLAAGITDTATSLTVNDATGYPTAPFAIEVEDEVILVGAKSGTTFSSLTRGADGTTNVAHSSGAVVEHTVIADDLAVIDWSRVDTSTNKVAGSDLATSYLPLSGGTMTGLVTLSGDPTANLHASTKQYVDNHTWVEADITDLGSYLPLSGGTMTGQLDLASTGLAGTIFTIDASRAHITASASGDKLRLETTGSTSDYLSFWRGGTRHGYMGFGDTSDNLYISNEATNAAVYLIAKDGGGTTRTRIKVDGSAGTSFYGNDGALKFVQENSQLRMLDNYAVSFGTDNDYYMKFNGSFLELYYQPTTGTGLIQIAGNGTATCDLKLLDGNLYLNDMYLKRGSNSALQVQTAYGYALIGPQNSTYCHIYTDRGSFYFNKSTLYANGSKIWHEGNDGSSSGLDADKVDGYHASDLGRLNATNTFLYTNYFGSIYPRSDSTYVSGNSANTWLSMRTISIYRDNEYANSSRKLKKFISPDVPGLDLVSALEPKRFQWRTGEGFKKRADQYKHKWGFIAEEVHDAVTSLGLSIDDTALPGFDEDGDPIYSADQLVPVLWKAIQEQQKQIEELKELV